MDKIVAHQPCMTYLTRWRLDNIPEAIFKMIVLIDMLDVSL